MQLHSIRSCMLLTFAASGLIMLTACGITVTAVHLPDSVQVNVGATAETAATYETAQDADPAAQQAAADKIDWSWTIGDDSIATVDENGIITGVKGGDTIVVVSSADGKMTAKCPVTVSQPLMAIRMDDIDLQTNGQSSATINYTLVPADTTEDNVTLSVDDDSVARLDGNRIIAVNNGETKITATCGIVKTSAKVTVTTKVEQIVLNKTEGVLTVGNTHTIKATVFPEDATDKAVTWKSSDESIATVDAEGNVTAKDTGNVTIMAVNSDGDVSSTYELTVKAVTCSYCGQTGHTSSNCSVKAADQKAAAQQQAQQQAAAQAAAQQAQQQAQQQAAAQQAAEQAAQQQAQQAQQAQQQPSGGNSGGGIAGSYGGDYLDQNPEFGYSSGIDWTQDNSNGENNNITD